MMAAETGGVCIKDEGKVREPRNAGRLWKLEKAIWEQSPVERPEETSAANPLTLAQ